MKQGCGDDAYLWWPTTLPTLSRLNTGLSSAFLCLECFLVLGALGATTTSLYRGLGGVCWAKQREKSGDVVSDSNDGRPSATRHLLRVQRLGRGQLLFQAVRPGVRLVRVLLAQTLWPGGDRRESGKGRRGSQRL